MRACGAGTARAARVTGGQVCCRCISRCIPRCMPGGERGEHGWWGPQGAGGGETQLELPGRGCLEIRACHVQAPAAGRTGAAEALGTLRADCGPLRIAPCHLRAHLHLHSGGPGRELRKLFQEAGIPPWRRARMPAVYSDRTLVAVAGLAVAAEWRAGADSQGWRLLWHDAAVRTGDYWHGQQRSAVV